MTVATTIRPSMIGAIAHEAARLVEQIVPTGEGACLGTCAILARVLADHGINAAAVRGEFDEFAHWWLEVDGWRLDPTRAQFDGGPLVEPVSDDSRAEDHYLPERALPARWDHEQAVAEFARMFEYGDTGEAHGWHVLHALTNFARRVANT